MTPAKAHKELILRWLLKALSTSVGRKFVMAITGLLLCGFLVAHLGGNLLLWAGDDGKSYNEYAHTLHKNEGLLMIAETGLFALFIAHIVIAFQVSAENRLARKSGYAMKQSKQEGRYSMEPWRPDQWMLVTGIVVLGFIILHLIDFKLELRGSQFYEANGKPFEPYDKAKALLSPTNPISLGGYAIGCLFLAFHLSHGVQSAFQTLGFNHPKYTPTVKIAGLLFALTIAGGFASFPLLWGFVANEGSTPKSVVQEVPPLPMVLPESKPQLENKPRVAPGGSYLQQTDIILGR